MSVYRAPVPSRTLAEHGILVLEARELTEPVTAALLAAVPHAQVATADGRPVFLERLNSARWSLIVVSSDVAGYPGGDALRDAREAAPGVVVAIGTAPAAHEVVAALRLGAEDFIDRARLQDLGLAADRLLAPADRSSAGNHLHDSRFARTTAFLAERHAMVLLDEHWIVTDCSRGVAAVLGYEAADIVGRPVEVFFDGLPDAPGLPQRLRTACGAEPVHGSGWMVRRDGLCMWAEVTCVADAAVQRRPRRFCLTVRDATLQYRASQSVRGQADSAAEATTARNLFLGSIAHELRSALSPISTSAMLLERQPLDSGRHERLLGIIRRNTASAARLLEDLLTFSTASKNKLLMRLENVDLHRLLSECAEAARPQATAAGLDLKLDFTATPEQGVRQCDPDRIRQVVVNLLGNAVKFTPRGGSIHVRSACGPEGFSIAVTDTGIGIKPEVLPSIFDPFEQGGAQVTSRFGGFGLGLAISAAIARQHGGRIVASSAGPGQGATFRLWLPANSAPADASAREPREPVALHVLYVEDNQDAADAMRYALTTLGWSMVHAPTCAGARALVAADANAFDVVLADLGLPDGSGLELGAELSDRLPVVALTAYGAPLAMQGFASQLIKPAEIVEVQRALLKAVAVHGNRCAS